MMTPNYPDLAVAALLLLPAVLSLRVVNRCLQVKNSSMREIEVDTLP